MERLTWNQMIEKYPDKWLALCNCKYYKDDGVTIIEADIYKTFNTDEEYEDFRIDNMEKEYEYRFTFTTEPVTSGVTYGENFTVELR